MKHVFRFLVLFLLLTSCNNDFIPSSIVNYKTNTFKIKLDKSVFVRKGKKIFYPCMDFDSFNQKPIYVLDNTPDYNEENIFVSPNSKILTIKENDKLIFIDTKGNVLDKIGKTKKDLYFEFEKNRFRLEKVQWSKDSKFLLLINDFSKENGEIINLISIYDFQTKTIKDIIKTHTIIDAYFSNDSKSIYYSYFKNPNLLSIKKVDISLQKEVSEMLAFPADSLFISFLKDDMHNHNFKQDSWVVEKWELDLNLRQDLLDGIYLYRHDTLKLIMQSTLSSPNFKGFSFSNHEKMKSYFLPGGDYYVFSNHSKEYSGYLVIDMKTFKYREIGSDIEFYYSLNSNEIIIESEKPKTLAMRPDLLNFKTIIK